MGEEVRLKIIIENYKKSQYQYRNLWSITTNTIKDDSSNLQIFLLNILKGRKREGCKKKDQYQKGEQISKLYTKINRKLSLCQALRKESKNRSRALLSEVILSVKNIFEIIGKIREWFNRQDGCQKVEISPLASKQAK